MTNTPQPPAGDAELRDILRHFYRKAQDAYNMELALAVENEAIDAILTRDKAQREALEIGIRINEIENIMRMVKHQDKHSGASWYRGYVSAQMKLREKLKKRITALHQLKDPERS